MLLLLLLLIDFPSKKSYTYFLYYTIQHMEEKTEICFVKRFVINHK